MQASEALLSHSNPEQAPPGAVLLRRALQPENVTYVDSGRVVLGILGRDGNLEHQLGLVQGPGWLDATSALLDLPCLMDGVAETEVVLRHLPRAVVRHTLAAQAASAHGVVVDVARAHRQQTELAVSRVAKDADARCAEWLLRHAQPTEAGASFVRLLERKRMIAAQLGIAPETLSRVFRHLRERNLISGAGRVVNLVDIAGLRALAGA